MESTTVVTPATPFADLTFLHNWREWEKAWGTTTLAEVRYGLLHLGFDVRVESDEEKTERILFYLDIADGYSLSEHFVRDDERGMMPYGGVYRTALGEIRENGLAPIRREVAEKAFHMLAMNVFRHFLRPDDADNWKVMARNHWLVGKFLWFFRPDGEERYPQRELRNLPFKRRPEKSVHAQIAWDFLMKFCEVAFLRGMRFEETWPTFTEILFYTHQTKVLLREEFLHVWSQPQCVEKLKTLITTTKLWLPSGLENTYRTPKTVGEAIYGGSDAAATFCVLQVKRAEQQRQGELREAIQQQRNIEQNIAELKK